MRRRTAARTGGTRSLRALVLALLLASAAQAWPVEAAPEDGSALLDRAFKNLYADDYVQMLWLRTRTRGGREMARRLQITRKQSERPGRALVRFLEPYAVRRTAILVLEKDDASDDQYVYLPAAERTMHLSASQRADSFFGTDLAYEDLEPKYADDYDVTRIGDESVGDIPCVRLELRPKPEFESSYERMETCIEPARGIMLWTDFYNRGKFWKRLEIDPTEVRPVQERFIPFRMTMTMPRRQSETVIETESYELRPEIPETIFSVFNLESGDARRDRARSGGTPPVSVPDVAAGPDD